MALSPDSPARETAHRRLRIPQCGLRGELRHEVREALRESAPKESPVEGGGRGGPSDPNFEAGILSLSADVREVVSPAPSQGLAGIDHFPPQNHR